MANEELTRLVTLAGQFNAAVTASSLAAELEEGIKAHTTAEEMDKLEKLFDEVQSEALDGAMDIAFGGEVIEPQEQFLKKNLVALDLLNDFMLRVVPAEKLAALVPAELKNAKDAEALKKAGAPKLASLCI